MEINKTKKVALLVQQYAVPALFAVLVLTIQLSLLRQLGFTTNSHLALAGLNSLLIAATCFANFTIFSKLTGKQDLKFQIISYLLSCNGLLLTSIYYPQITFALLLLLSGLALYFSQRPFGIFLQGVSCLLFPELCIFPILCLIENFKLHRVKLNYTFFELGLLISVLAYWQTSSSWQLPAVANIQNINFAIPGAKDLMTFLAQMLLGPYITKHYPWVIMLFFSLTTVLFIFFALAHLHAPDFVIRDQRNNIVGLGALIILCFYIFAKINYDYLTLSLFYLPLIQAIYIAAANKLDNYLTTIFGLLALPLVFNFYKLLWAALLSVGYLGE